MPVPQVGIEPTTSDFSDQRSLPKLSYQGIKRERKDLFTEGVPEGTLTFQFRRLTCYPVTPRSQRRRERDLNPRRALTTRFLLAGGCSATQPPLRNGRAGIVGEAFPFAERPEGKGTSNTERGGFTDRYLHQ